MASMEEEARKRFKEAEERNRKKRDEEEKAGKSNILDSLGVKAKAALEFINPNQFTNKATRKIKEGTSK